MSILTINYLIVSLLAKSGLMMFIPFAVILPFMACVNDSTSFVPGRNESDSSQIKHFDPDPLDSLYANVPLNISTEFQIDKLDKLGKIWGFLKYYHPAVAAGKFDWDSELCKILPVVDSCSSVENFNSVLIEWIDGLGRVKPSKVQVSGWNYAGEVQVEPDFGWVYEENILNKTLKKEIQNIFINRKRDSNFYFSIELDGNPRFTNEIDHDSRSYPIPVLRLLSLFRYWNYVAYFFPYRDLIGQKWNKGLTDFIPKMLNSKNAVEYALTCRKLISRIHDTHADIYGTNEALDEAWGVFYPPFRSAVIERKLVVTGYYKDTLDIKSKISVGDIIEAIGGQPVADLINSHLEDYPASNEAAKLREMPLTLLRSKGDPFELKIRQGDQLRSIEIPACNRKTLFNEWYESSRNGKCFKLLPGNVAYLTAQNYTVEQQTELQAIFAGTKGLIIDLRGYPKEPMFPDLMDWLKPTSSAFAIASTVDSTTPGVFRLKEPIRSGAYQDKCNYSKPVVVLVNAETQSEAEYTVMSLQSRDKVRVIGSQTAGADGDITWFHLPGRILTNFSAIGIYYPDKSDTQRKGIRIDEKVSPTVMGVREGKDEVLEAGLNVLKQMTSNF